MHSAACGNSVGSDLAGPMAHHQLFPRVRLYLTSEEEEREEAQEQTRARRQAQREVRDLRTRIQIRRKLRKNKGEVVVVRIRADAIGRFRAAGRFLQRQRERERVALESGARARLRPLNFLLGLDAPGVSGHWWPESSPLSFHLGYTPRIHDVDMTFLPEDVVGGFYPTPGPDSVVYSGNGLLALADYRSNAEFLHPGIPSGSAQQTLRLCLVNMANRTWITLPLLLLLATSGASHRRVMLEVTPGSGQDGSSASSSSGDGGSGVGRYRCRFQVGVFWMDQLRPMWGVYSSWVGRWIVRPLQVPEALKDASIMAASPVLVQGTVAVPYSCPCDAGGCESKLVAFDVGTGRHVGTWDAPPSMPPRMLVHSWQGQHICMNGGKVVWVVQSGPREVTVWIRDYVAHMWVLCSALPPSSLVDDPAADEPGSFSLRDVQTAGEMLYLAFRVSVLPEAEDPWDVVDVDLQGPDHGSVLVGYHIHSNTWHFIVEESSDPFRSLGRADRIITGEWRPELYLQ